MFITIQVETGDAAMAAMLQRIVTPLANAIAESIKPELESMRAQAEHANDLAQKARDDLDQVNAKRIEAEAVVADQRLTIERQRTQIVYLENEALKAIADKDKAEASVEERVAISVEKYNAKCVELDSARAKLDIMRGKLLDMVDSL